MSTYGLWLSAAGMKVSEHRQNILANNMANSATTGFKQDLAIVTQRRVESRSNLGGLPFAHPVLDKMTGGINVRPSFTNLAPGPIDTTGRNLDLAIEGRGFFAVSDGTQTRYTRDGNFSTNRNGELILAAGDGCWKVLDDAGTPITLQPDLAEPIVSTDGNIRQGTSEVARLGFFEAANPAALRKAGENLFDPGISEMPPTNANLIPGALERSNVDVLPGLADMITAGRAYEMNANMIRLQDETAGQAISRVGRIV